EFPAEPGEASIVLQRGRTLQRINGKPRGKTFVVRLPSRLVRVDGTEFLTAVGNQERVAVTHGEVEVGEGRKVGEGQAGRFGRDAPLVIDDISPEDLEALDVDAIELPSEDMVFVPGGKYRMGGRGEQDAPRREVLLSGFLVDRREVSNEEYARYAAATGARVPNYFADGEPPEGQQRLPVHQLSLAMAAGYAAWAGKRLPTEAQWEAAARGPGALAYPWGNRPLPSVEELPHVAGGQFKVVVTDLAPVDADTPDVSPFGVRSMMSSVAEWCRDWYADDAYTRGQDEDPQGPRAGIWRVIRGHWSARQPSVTARKKTSEEDDQSGAGVRSVLEPER
ncbi:MAG: formylglycine-generating enzyme family protein, partial [Planctomycetota bacterium]